MSVPGCPAISGHRKRLGFWVLLVLIFAAIAAWRMGTALSVAAQAMTKVNPQDGLTYVWIPPGTFQMGCSPDDSDCQDDERPARSVTLTKGFWLGQTPVTQVAYKKVVGANPSNFKGDQLPVEQVSWDDAHAYCQAVEMRLPTEAEWEYAARGGSSAPRYAPLARIAWYIGNSMEMTHEVAQKQANAYGLYDMLGNVWEWVADWFAPYYGAGTVDPKGPSRGTERVMRGGSWVNVPPFARASYRDGDEPSLRLNDLGFRCAGE